MQWVVRQVGKNKWRAKKQLNNEVVAGILIIAVVLLMVAGQIWRSFHG